MIGYESQIRSGSSNGRRQGRKLNPHLWSAALWTERTPVLNLRPTLFAGMSHYSEASAGLRGEQPDPYNTP